jgi:hypothetical protein
MPKRRGRLICTVCPSDPRTASLNESSSRVLVAGIGSANNWFGRANQCTDESFPWPRVILRYCLTRSTCCDTRFLNWARLTSRIIRAVSYIWASKHASCAMCSVQSAGRRPKELRMRSTSPLPGAVSGVDSLRNIVERGGSSLWTPCCLHIPFVRRSAYGILTGRQTMQDTANHSCRLAILEN